MSFISCLSGVLEHKLYMKSYLFKGCLSLKELEKNLHNIASINSKFYINIDGISFTSVELCSFSLLKIVLLRLAIKPPIPSTCPQAKESCCCF